MAAVGQLVVVVVLALAALEERTALALSSCVFQEVVAVLVLEPLRPAVPLVVALVSAQQRQAQRLAPQDFPLLPTVVLAVLVVGLVVQAKVLEVAGESVLSSLFLRQSERQPTQLALPPMVAQQERSPVVAAAVV